MARYRSKAVCTKGTECGRTCIASWKTCHKNGSQGGYSQGGEGSSPGYWVMSTDGIGGARMPGGGVGGAGGGVGGPTGGTGGPDPLAHTTPHVGGGAALN